MTFLISGKKSANWNSPKFNDKRSDDKEIKLFAILTVNDFFKFVSVILKINWISIKRGKFWVNLFLIILMIIASASGFH